MSADHVHSVGVAIPDHLNCCERMVPAEIHPTYARPVRREIPMLTGDRFLGDRKNTTGAKNGNAFGPGFHFVRRVTGNNLFLFIFAIMLNVIDRHNDLKTVVRFLVKKSLNNGGDAL